MSDDYEDDDDVGGIVTFSSDIMEAEAPLPLPEGTYAAEIRDVKVVKRKSSGKKGIDVFVHVAPEDYPPDFDVEEAPEGVTLVYRRINLDNTKTGHFRLRRLIETIGAPPVRQTLSDDDLRKWKGLNVKAVIKHDTWEDVTRPTVERLLPVD
jgi:hypothetical protein